MTELNYCSVVKVESPTVGNLYAAREWKKNAYQKVRGLRARLQSERQGGSRGSLRLELLNAESDWKAAILLEQQCLTVIEQDANRLGLTTKREPKE